MTTVLVTPEELAGGEAAVEGDAYRHLFRARRLAVGDRVKAVDGAGRARWAEIAAIDRRRAVLALGEPAPTAEPAYRLELLVAAPRKERAAWLVEKATELGVTAVRFVASDRAPRQLGDGTLARLERVARAAVEQCGRARVPEITGIHPWDELESLLAPQADRWRLDPAADDGFERAPPEGPAGAVLVGPEGGWTDAELARLAELGCRGVSLGERVLRIETAAVVAAARLLTGGPSAAIRR